MASTVTTSKDEAAATEEISKRKRGRPSKVEAAATEEITKRKRGRPPKDECRSPTVFASKE